MVWKKIQELVWSLQDIRRISWRQQKKSKQVPKKNMIMSMSNIFSMEFIIESLSTKNIWKLTKSEFNIYVGRTRIIEILNSNGYKYRLPKLRVKIKYNTEIWD